MAENESLDLRSPRAQRWNAVRDAARKGAACQEVASSTRIRLYAAFRNALKQFKGYGVSTADFLVARYDRRALQQLVRQTEGHPYAKLLMSVLNADPVSSGAKCLKKWGHAALDTIFDQIGHGIAGTEHFPSFFTSQLFFGEVRRDLEADLQRIATKLDENPEWEPRRAARKGAPVEEPTAELLPMSLLVGGAKR